MKPPRSPDNRRGHSDSTDSAARSVGASAQAVREEAALAVGGGNRSCRRTRSVGGRRSQRRRTDRTNIPNLHPRSRIINDYKGFDNYPGTDHHRVERADTRADHNGRSTSRSCCADHDCRGTSAARCCPRADYNSRYPRPANRGGARAGSACACQRLLQELCCCQSRRRGPAPHGRPRLSLRLGSRWRWRGLRIGPIRYLSSGSRHRVADGKWVRSEADREDAGHPKLAHGGKLSIRYQSRSASRASQVMVTSSGSVIAMAVGLWDRKRVSVET